MTRIDGEDPIGVLPVEDNPGEIRRTEEALTEVPLDTDGHVVRRGDEALDYRHQRTGTNTRPARISSSRT